MEFEQQLQETQKQLVAQDIDGWLLYDFRHSNPLAYTFLKIAPLKMPTRRFFYWIPQQGDPIKIVPLIEPYTLDHLPGTKWLYRSWQELEQQLSTLATKDTTLAMEYSPYNALPMTSMVDAGTIELLRRTGATIVSSADILQFYTSVWRPEQLQSHLAAAKILEETVAQTWQWIEQTLQQRLSIDEYAVQQFMLTTMQAKGCETADAPTCAINVHSADPHYIPKQGQAAVIQPGDFILLDLWCKQRQPGAVYADITRVGVAAKQATPRQQKIFAIVKGAQDCATRFIKEYYETQRPIQGWQVDEVCRCFIYEAGYEEYFIHRTGHNIAENVHGPGANLDNLETHDYRQLLPGTGFSVEPGIYLPGEFGVRLEYDVYLHPTGSIQITGGIQEEIVCLQI